MKRYNLKEKLTQNSVCHDYPNSSKILQISNQRVVDLNRAKAKHTIHATTHPKSNGGACVCMYGPTGSWGQNTGDLALLCNAVFLIL